LPTYAAARASATVFCRIDLLFDALDLLRSCRTGNEQTVRSYETGGLEDKEKTIKAKLLISCSTLLIFCALAGLATNRRPEVKNRRLGDKEKTSRTKLLIS
jgi:hypothetical protein